MRIFEKKFRPCQNPILSKESLRIPLLIKHKENASKNVETSKIVILCHFFFIFSFVLSAKTVSVCLEVLVMPANHILNQITHHYPLDQKSLPTKSDPTVGFTNTLINLTLEMC